MLISKRPRRPAAPSRLRLDDGARVGVIGGGPAGSLFSYFLLTLAERAALELDVTIFEPRDFTRPAPAGCNMCGGIVSESLVQNLATEGVNLPAAVVQRGLDSYVLHMDVGSVRVATPLAEKRIAAVFRGPGPRDVTQVKGGSFDGFLQALAVEKGARVIRARVDQVSRHDGRLRVGCRGQEPAVYDLVAVAAGVNTGALNLFQALDPGYRPPRVAKTFIREYYLGAEAVSRHFGSSMHVFLLNHPGLEFAAIVPKGDYVTLCLLGDDISPRLLELFLDAREVRACMPPGWQPDRAACQCAPHLSIAGATHPFGDRLVFVGDCGVTRLYKDGIGAAYRAAKAAARTAVFHGIAREDFRRHYWPVCRSLAIDNDLGRIVFAVTGQIQKRAFARRAVWRMTTREQQNDHTPQRMSTVLWDTFTGSAPYRQILLRTLHPMFLGRFLLDNVGSLLTSVPGGVHGRPGAERPLSQPHGSGEDAGH